MSTCRSCPRPAASECAAKRPAGSTRISRTRALLPAPAGQGRQSRRLSRSCPKGILNVNNRSCSGCPGSSRTAGCCRLSRVMVPSGTLWGSRRFGRRRKDRAADAGIGHRNRPGLDGSRSGWPHSAASATAAAIGRQPRVGCRWTRPAARPCSCSTVRSPVRRRAPEIGRGAGEDLLHQRGGGEAPWWVLR